MLASVSAAMSTSLVAECGDPEVAEQYLPIILRWPRKIGQVAKVYSTV